MPPSHNGSLGRGLGELMGGIPASIGSAATISSTGFVRLSPDLIGLSREGEVRAQEAAPELVESIRVHGVLQPILVRRRTQGYEVVVGARRLVAARLAGLKEIPAVIVHATDDEALELSRVENTCRETVIAPLPPSEPVKPVEVVVETWNWTPVRIGMAVTAAILLLGLGAGAGVGLGWVGSHEAQVPPPVPPAVEPVAAPVPVSVVAETRVPPPIPVLDVSELKALESEGLTLVMESNATVRVVFNAPLFSSRVTLAEEGAGLLTKLGVILAKHSAEWEVVVTGHTDAVPLRGNGLYRDNQELGLARAQEVVRYLMRESQVPATRLYAATAGEDNPPYPGDDAEARRKNRTVTLQVRQR